MLHLGRPEQSEQENVTLGKVRARKNFGIILKPNLVQLYKINWVEINTEKQQNLNFSSQPASFQSLCHFSLRFAQSLCEIVIIGRKVTRKSNKPNIIT